MTEILVWVRGGFDAVSAFMGGTVFWLRWSWEEWVGGLG